MVSGGEAVGPVVAVGVGEDPVLRRVAGDEEADAGQRVAGFVGHAAGDRPAGEKLRVDAGGHLAAGQRDDVSLGVGRRVVPPLLHETAAAVAKLGGDPGALGQSADRVVAGGVGEGPARPIPLLVDELNADVCPRRPALIGDGALHRRSWRHVRVGDEGLSVAQLHRLHLADGGGVVVELLRVAPPAAVAVHDPEGGLGASWPIS